MKGKLILENGKIFEGKIFGELKDTVGEIYFNTNMSGYEEMMTDPAVYKTIMVMTYPMIGNYGLNIEDMESSRVQLSGLIIKEDAKLPNNFRCEMTLDGFLRQYGVTGFKGIDTRYLTQIIRENGNMKALITTEELTKKEIQQKFDNFSNNNAVLEVTTKEKVKIPGKNKKIGILDLGMRKSILNYFKAKNNNIIIFPATTRADEILNEGIEKLIISNGPGNPENLKETINNIKELIGKIEIFGEVLGAQVLTLALDGEIKKAKYGHRGGAPVKDLENKKVITVSENSGYEIAKLPKNIKITHTGINQNTIEGFENKDLKIKATQFEATFEEVK